ncbi:hypothetical protein T10_206 [Trichinella papuae]|uniref:Uncharacterized protein n=1 Tax=Trichinella papuae TaxID=268474 RepID=A0A0V1MA86_9BILA|nr:hypothetical protein T10_206 [Trichinella papuae]
MVSECQKLENCEPRLVESEDLLKLNNNTLIRSNSQIVESNIGLDTSERLAWTTKVLIPTEWTREIFHKKAAPTNCINWLRIPWQGKSNFHRSSRKKSTDR